MLHDMRVAARTLLRAPLFSAAMVATIAIAVGASLLIGVVASVLPSRRAARLNVLEAITYE